MKHPDSLLSIVVPTRNRQSFALEVVQSIRELKDEDIEIIVEDNSDNDSLRQKLVDCADDRIRYFYSRDRRTQSENYNAAAARCSGEYWTFIGDDDTVLSFLPAAARWARDQKIDAVLPTNTAHYIWPNLHIKGRIAGSVRCEYPTWRIEVINGELAIRESFAVGAQSFGRLPRAYYGLVRGEVMHSIKLKTGSYFPGVSPDISSAIAIATIARRIVSIDGPLFLPGSSLGSNAGASGLRQHVGEVAEQPHLGAAIAASWSKYIPLLYTVETIWAEAAISAAIRCGRDIREEFNFAYVYARLLTYYPQYRTRVLKAYLNARVELGRPAVRWIVALASECTSLFFKRVVARTRSLIPLLQSRTIAFVGKAAVLRIARRQIEDAIPRPPFS